MRQVLSRKAADVYMKRWDYMMDGTVMRIDPQLAAVTQHGLARHRQADAAALVLAAPVQALEEVEDPLGVLHVEADAVVAAREAGDRARAGG